MFKIRNELKAEKLSYIDSLPEISEDMLDCSLGVNPYGFPQDALAKAVSSFDLRRLNGYPHSHAAVETVIDYFRVFAALSEKNVLLTNGSIGAIYIALSIFSSSDTEVVCFTPTFTDTVEYAKMIGMVLNAVPSDPKKGLKPDVEAMVKTIRPTTSVVYIDNPNNPTGWVLSLSEIERVLKTAKSNGACLIVDEAYGDFIPRSESSVSLLDKYENLIVIRSMSKGFGLAGMRAGYLLSSETLIGYMQKISNLYVVGEFSREIMSAVMRRPEFPISHSLDIAEMKRLIRQNIGNRLTISATDDRIPIFTLMHKDPGVNLHKLLIEQGVLAVSGNEFENTDGSMVRVRVPRMEQFQKLLDAVKAIDKGQ